MKVHPGLSASKPPKASEMITQATLKAYWSLPPEQLFSELKTSKNGFTPADAGQRLNQYGANIIEVQQQSTAFRLLPSQFKSPLVLILVFAVIFSGIVGEWGERAVSSSVAARVNSCWLVRWFLLGLPTCCHFCRSLPCLVLSLCPRRLCWQCLG